MSEESKPEKPPKPKSKSQRLRAVLFLNWQQDNEGFDTFEKYYDIKMELLISSFRFKLPS